MAQGPGKVLAPSFPGFQMQWVDVRDVCDFTLARCEALDADTYNVVGPQAGMASRPTLKDLLNTAASVTGSSATVVYVDDTEVRSAAASCLRWEPKRRFVDETELPGLWEPAMVISENATGIGPDPTEAWEFVKLAHATSNAKAVAAGLTFRSLEETIAGAMAKSGTLLADGVLEGSWGLSAEDEAQVLEKVANAHAAKL